MDHNTLRKRLLHDRRGGGTIEKVFIIALFIFAGVVGLRRLGTATKTSLECQGEVVRRPDGTTACAGAAATASGGSAILANNSPTPQGFVCTGRNGCLCFVAGTPVLTASGLQAIESIQPGTLVWARDEKGGAFGWKPVLETFVSRSHSLVRMTVRAAEGETETLEVTPNHPFFAVDRGWIRTDQIIAGRDRLVDRQGRPIEVLATDSRPAEVPVFNLEVADYHTYFAGRMGVWAHNLPTDPSGDCGAGGGSANGFVNDLVVSANGAPPLPPPRRPKPYTLLPPGSFASNTQFPAQEQTLRVTNVSSVNSQTGQPEPNRTFQSAPGQANIVYRNKDQATLAVSPNGLLAIEQAGHRQAKTFFARQDLVAGWNDTLISQGSYFQLSPQPAQTVTFNNPATNIPQILIRVDVQNRVKNNAGCNATIAGSCDQAVLEVTGSRGSPVPTFRTNPPLNMPTDGFTAHQQYSQYYATEVLVPGALPQPLKIDKMGANLEAIKEQLETAGQTYVAAIQNKNPGDQLDQKIRELGINEYVRPNAGQAVAIFRIGPMEMKKLDANGKEKPILDENGDVIMEIRDGKKQLKVERYDFLHAEHWGGVIASDGGTYITLENYERKAEGDWNPSTDPRFFVAMYGDGPKQSFHDRWRHGHPQAMTVVANALPSTLNLKNVLDTQARRHFGDGTGVANAFPDVATATNRNQEAVAYLKGLAYANHLLNNPPIPPGELANVSNWKAALKNTPLLDPENAELRKHTLDKFTEAKDTTLTPNAARLRRLTRFVRNRPRPPRPHVIHVFEPN